MLKFALIAPLISGVCVGLCGCMDGPFYAMKKMNPYYRKEWQKDRELGPTYTQRIEELELLEKRLADYAPDDQLRWAMQLEQLIQSDRAPSCDRGPSKPSRPLRTTTSPVP